MPTQTNPSLKLALMTLIITGYAETESILRRPDDVPVLAKPFNQQQLCEAINLATCRRAIAAE